MAETTDTTFNSQLTEIIETTKIDMDFLVSVRDSINGFDTLYTRVSANLRQVAKMLEWQDIPPSFGWHLASESVVIDWHEEYANNPSAISVTVLSIHT